MNEICYTIEDTKETGNKTIKVVTPDKKTVYIHSKHFPSREQKTFESVFREIKTDTIIVLGLGLGYHIPEHVHTDKVKRIIGFDILDIPTSEIDSHSKIPAIKGIDFLCNYGISFEKLRTKIENLFSQHDISGLSFIEHPASVRLFPEYYESIKNICTTLIKKKAGNIATINSFSNLFIRNSLKKIASLDSYYPFSALENKYKNESCIIVSSAPSTDHFINSIAQYSQNHIIIAVDSALSILHTHNIIPDYIFSTDPQPWTEEHIFNTPTASERIIAFSAHIHHQKEKKSYLFSNSHPLSQITEHIIPNIGSADSRTGCVAGDAIFAAIRMGFSHVFMVGTDFSFPNHTIYSKDSVYNHRYSYIYNSRLQPCESLHMNYIRRSTSTTDHGIRTRHSFLHFHDNIEKMISSFHCIKFYHFVHNGLHLSGTQKISEISDASSLLASFKKSDYILKTKDSSSDAIKKTKKMDVLRLLSDDLLFTSAITESSSSDYLNKKKNIIKALLHKLIGNTL